MNIQLAAAAAPDILLSRRRTQYLVHGTLSAVAADDPDGHKLTCPVRLIVAAANEVEAIIVAYRLAVQRYDLNLNEFLVHWSQKPTVRERL